ncbi:MAG: hypothetical protein M0Q13_13650 [Methanothrix sp.]|nr:hypothetical protein [Methanothrix sp.]
MNNHPVPPGPQARPAFRAPECGRLSGKPARPDDSAASPDGLVHNRIK